jgi:hypothetical protein
MSNTAPRNEIAKHVAAIWRQAEKNGGYITPNEVNVVTGLTTSACSLWRRWSERNFELPPLVCQRELLARQQARILNTLANGETLTRTEVRRALGIEIWGKVFTNWQNKFKKYDLTIPRIIRDDRSKTWRKEQRQIKNIELRHRLDKHATLPPQTLKAISKRVLPSGETMFLLR